MVLAVLFSFTGLVGDLVEALSAVTDFDGFLSLGDVTDPTIGYKENRN